MCSQCDLNTLNPHGFDSFFDIALAAGARTMVCRHCGAVFSTEILLLASNRPQVSNFPTGVA